jgi:hypothetical protein
MPIVFRQHCCPGDRIQIHYQEGSTIDTGKKPERNLDMLVIFRYFLY